MKKIFKTKKFWLFILIIIFLLFLSGDKNNKPDINTSYNNFSGERNFYMGFSLWPPSATLDGIKSRDKMIQDYSDITLIHIDNGIPWQESLDNSEYHPNVLKKWRDENNSVPKNNKKILAIGPLNMDRGELALGWNENENVPLNIDWEKANLNDEKVKKAYLTYAKRNLEFFKPDYFVIGIEVNELLDKNKSNWPQYKELHEYVYTNLKKQFPDTPIFASYVLKDDIVNDDDDIYWLKNNNDILAISTHPHVHGNKINNNYFDKALKFDMPIAITEMGLPSRSFSALGYNFEYTEEDQKKFIEMILNEAQNNNFVFVINWANLDYDKLLEIFPEGQIRDFGKIWAYTGLKRSDNTNKLAMDVWTNFFNR